MLGVPEEQEQLICQELEAKILEEVLVEVVKTFMQAMSEVLKVAVLAL